MALPADMRRGNAAGSTPSGITSTNLPGEGSRAGSGPSEVLMGQVWRWGQPYRDLGTGHSGAAFSAVECGVSPRLRF